MLYRRSPPAPAGASPDLAKDTAWYAGTRARVEAKAELEQAEELRRELEVLGTRMGK
jgi:hypothetical protein